MFGVNTRGSFLCSKLCIPHLRRAENPHILMLSPPLTHEPRWFAPHLAYSIAKYGMSLCVLGLAEELKRDNIAVNALWPRTVKDRAVRNCWAATAAWPARAAPKSSPTRVVVPQLEQPRAQGSL